MSAAAPWLVGALVGLALLLGAGGVAPQREPLRRLGAAAASSRPRSSAGGARPWRRGGPEQAAEPALVMDLLAAALLSGAPVTAALGVVGEAVGGPDGERLRTVAGLLSMGALPEVAWAGTGPRWEPVARCLALAAASGAPTAGLLHRAAQLERADRGARQAAAAQRLGVRVLLPMGLCALPGFAALGVVPLVLALAGSLTGA